MFLSDRDLEFAVKSGLLIVDPAPAEYDTTSIDLHLDRVEGAKVWDLRAFEAQQAGAGVVPAVLPPGRFVPREFGAAFCVPVPEGPTRSVYRTGRAVVLRPQGFFLWQTHERVGTPEVNPRLLPWPPRPPGLRRRHRRMPRRCDA
jgi:deoxycytidine triphosphate deaminase